MFKDHQAPAKLVTRQFDGLLHQNMRRFNIADDQMANLFDFFVKRPAFPVGSSRWLI
ncbi:hypothetical protein P3T69_16650 [Lactiplantibacillus plantarum]|nr:hypothetical protein P3T69_16650 [Lactiplantibacillus plantarum]